MVVSEWSPCFSRRVLRLAVLLQQGAREDRFDDADQFSNAESAGLKRNGVDNLGDFLWGSDPVRPGNVAGNVPRLLP